MGPVSARHRPRRITATALVVIGTFFLLVGGMLLYTRQEVVNSHAFAAHASHALQDENVRAAIGDGVLNQVTTGGGAQLLSFRPALESVIDGVIASPQFRAVFRKAAVHAHDLLLGATARASCWTWRTPAWRCRALPRPSPL